MSSGESASRTTVPPSSRLVCAGCGAEVVGAADLAAADLRCPRRGEGDADHVLQPVFAVSAGGEEALRELFLDPEPDPFLRYRRLLHAHATALELGFDDGDFRDAVARIDDRVAEVDGHGFRETPFLEEPGLAAALGVASVRVKDETDNVSGSHKARHLMGVALWLDLVERAGVASFGDLAIASCGNAALAAAVVARAVDRPLDVYVPPGADPAVVARLEALGARLHRCPRRSGEAGDPCFLRFREATAAGALPFSCQGSENGLIADGGRTLAWEMVSVLLRESGEGSARPADRLFLQVGGGALASSTIQGLRLAHDLGLLASLPRLHAVQSEGCSPLVRAWDRVTEWMGERLGERLPSERGARAAHLAVAPSEAIDEALRHAARHRSDFMSPWEDEPRSLAYGILDDESYDWLAVVEGMLRSGGWPVIAREATLLHAWELGHRVTAVPVCTTGSAGLAGALELAAAGELGGGERLAVLFTGVERSAPRLGS